MSSKGRKIGRILLLVMLVAYGIVAARYCTVRERELKCTGIDIVVRDSSELAFVTPEIVLGWLQDSAIRVVGMGLRGIDVYAIERLVEAHEFVAWAEAYTAIDGRLHIDLGQRKPVMRVVSESGHNFYVDDELVLLPSQSDYIADVPVVSGRLTFGFPTDCFGRLDEKKFPAERELLHNLLNFVRQVDTDPFLDALTAQIYYDGREVRLLPRVGRQVIRFGEVGDSVAVVRRLGKLSRFYRRSFADGWWRSATEIDLRFRGQVVSKNPVAPLSDAADGDTVVPVAR